LKKILNYFVMGAVAVMFSAALASCQKESANEKTSTPEAPEVHVIHVELDATVADTKATYSTASKEITIQSGDALYVALTQPTSATWSGATGILTYDGTSFKGDITYTGTYSGSDIITDAKDLTATFLPKGYSTVGYLSSTGVATATNAFYAAAKDAAVPQLVHLTATVSDQAGSAKTPLTLVPQNAVLCYSIAANKVIAGAYTVSVSDGTTTISGSVTAVADAATTFAVAFPATATSKDYTLRVPAYENVVKSGKTLAAGKVINISIAAITPTFSVDAGKYVKFAKGNLTRVSGKWAFLSNSWEYNTNAATVNTTDGAQHFQWETVFQAVSSGESAVVSGITTDLGSGWHGLSLAEWRYLLGYDSGNSGVQSSRRTVQWHYYAKITGAGVGTGNKRYLLIFPDSFKESDWNTTTMGTKPTSFDATTDNSIAYTANNFAAMQSAGIVILPAAGYRGNSSWSYVGVSGCYWSSTSYSDTNAYFMGFYSSLVGVYNDTKTNDKTYYYFPVRLVQNQ